MVSPVIPGRHGSDRTVTSSRHISYLPIQYAGVQYTAFNYVASVAVTQFVHLRPLSNVQQQG